MVCGKVPPHPPALTAESDAEPQEHHRASDANGYFPRDEYKRILDAIYRLDDGLERGYGVKKRGQRIRTLVPGHFAS